MSPSIETSMEPQVLLFFRGNDLEGAVVTPSMETVTEAERFSIFSPEAEVLLVEKEDKLIESDASDFMNNLSMIAFLDFLDF
jgi:hypothetical protein